MKFLILVHSSNNDEFLPYRRIENVLNPLLMVYFGVIDAFSMTCARNISGTVFSVFKNLDYLYPLVDLCSV